MIPHRLDLLLAAEKGWLDILQWAYGLGLDKELSMDLAVTLAINNHFKAADWLVEATKIIIPKNSIEKFIVAGAVKALQWNYKKRPFMCVQKWVDLAAENRQMSVLKWIYKEFKLLPTTFALKSATAEMLDWIKATQHILINEALVSYGAGNFELLQWIYKNAPISIFDNKKLILSLAIHNRNMMEWLYNKLKISPANMNWAYEAGDLEAIQWALNNCQILPTVKNIAYAIENGRLNIITWFHKNYPEHLEISEALKVKKSWKDRPTIDYIISQFESDTILTFDDLGDSTDWDWRLNFLKWIRKRGHCFGESLLNEEMYLVASSGQLEHFFSFHEAFPEIVFPLKTMNSLARRGHHKAYKWFMEHCYERNIIPRLCGNIQAAFKNGHLEIVKLILHRYPKFFKKISKLEVTRLNYHIKCWLDNNVKQTGIFPFQSILAS